MKKINQNLLLLILSKNLLIFFLISLSLKISLIKVNKEKIFFSSFNLITSLFIFEVNVLQIEIKKKSFVHS
jgi:hypothetical protein